MENSQPAFTAEKRKRKSPSRWAMRNGEKVVVRVNGKPIFGFVLGLFEDRKNRTKTHLYKVTVGLEGGKEEHVKPHKLRHLVKKPK